MRSARPTRRRQVQEEYNTEHGITPTTIIKSIDATLVTAYEADYFKVPLDLDAFAGILAKTAQGNDPTSSKPICATPQKR